MANFIMGATLKLQDNFTNPIKNMTKATDAFKNSTDKARSSMGQASNAMHNHGNTAKTVSRTLGTFKDAHGKIRDEWGRFIPGAKKAGDAIHKMKNHADHASHSFGKMYKDMLVMSGVMAAVTATLAAPIVGFKWLVSANADMETYRNTLAVVLKDQNKANEALTWATKFAASTPFEIPQIVEATTRMSAYGLNAQKTLGIVGDMASVMGKDLMQAVEAVADAQTGELERLKEFGITKDMIKQQAKLLGSNPINNKGQITDQKAFNAALFKLMENRYKGGMEIQSKTFKGMISNAKDFIGSMGRTLGAPIFEQVKKSLANVLTYFEKIQSSGAIDAMAGKIQKGIDKMGTAINFIKKNWGTIGPVLAGVAAGLASYVIITKTISTVTKAWAGAQKLLNAALALSPTTWIILGIAALIGIIVLAYLKFEKFRNVVNAVWASVKQGVTTAIQAISNWVKTYGPIIKAGIMTAFTAVYNWVKTYWPGIRDTIVAVFTYVWTKIAPIVTMIKNNIVSAFTAVVTWITTYGPRIWQLITQIWNTIKTVTQIAWAFFAPIIKGALTTIVGIIKGGFDLAVAIIKYVWTTIAAIIKGAWTIIMNTVGFFINLFTGHFKDALKNVVEIFKGLGTMLKEVFVGVGTVLYDSGKAIMETLATGIKAAIKAPVEAVKSVFNKVREMLPFSDAHEGPLSQLTLSGKRIMTTLGKGVIKGQDSLYNAVDRAFSSIPTVPQLYTTLSVGTEFDNAKAPTYSSSYGVSGGANPAGAAKTASVSKTTTIEKLIEKIELHDVGNKNATQLVEEIIDVLYDKLKGADDIISSGDMGVVL